MPGQVGQPPQAVQQKAHFDVINQYPYCPTPPGTWPGSWNSGANAAGPVVSGRQEGVSGGDFISVLHPLVRRWIRNSDLLRQI